MSEETREWIAQSNERAKRMFEDTKNPYWILYSLWLTKNFFSPSDWAVNAIVTAAADAISASNAGEELSLDKALGLKTKRGGTPVAKSAARDAKLGAALELVDILHLYFDISKEAACEFIYFSLDISHCSDLDGKADMDLLHCASKRVAADEPKYAELPEREILGRVAEREILGRVFDLYKELSEHEDHIQKRRAIWSTTFEQTLGISLETFIAKAHRVKRSTLERLKGEHPELYALRLHFAFLDAFAPAPDRLPPPYICGGRWRKPGFEKLSVRAEIADQVRSLEAIRRDPGWKGSVPK